MTGPPAAATTAVIPPLSTLTLIRLPPPAAPPLPTRLPGTGESSQAGCLLCTPGSYCASTSSPGPSGPCSAGYFCNG